MTVEMYYQCFEFSAFPYNSGSIWALNYTPQSHYQAPHI